MAFVKKVAEGAASPLKAVKKNPWTLVGIALVILIAFRFRTQIMSALGKIPFIGSGANKLAGEG